MSPVSHVVHWLLDLKHVKSFLVVIDSLDKHLAQPLVNISVIYMIHRTMMHFRIKVFDKQKNMRYRQMENFFQSFQYTPSNLSALLKIHLNSTV